MSKIKYLIIFSFVFLVGCVQTADEWYNEVKSKECFPGIYCSLVCPEKNLRYGKFESTYCTVGRDFNQQRANEQALSRCASKSLDCVVVKENDKFVYSLVNRNRELKEIEMNRYITQCEYIGFKKNTEKMGECVLKISQTERQIINSQVNNSGRDSSTNLILLQESLKLLQPPTSPRRNVRCTYNTVGGILGVNCF